MVVKNTTKAIDQLIESSMFGSVNLDFNKGVFISIDLDPTGVRKIWDYFSKLGLPLMPIQQAHVTVVYSKSKPSEIPRIKEINGSVSPKAIKLFGKGTQKEPYVLVVELHSPDLQKLRNWYLKEYNLKPTYKDFNPHLTLTYDIQRILPGLKNLRPKQKESIENIFSLSIKDLPKNIRVLGQTLEGLND